jgi:hypothetical protein
MRLLRLVLMLLLAGSLAASPVLAATAMANAAKAQVSMADSGGDCPCCDHGAVKTASALCCHVLAVPATVFVMQEPGTEVIGDRGQDVLVGVVARPEPPPPRSELA